MKDDRQLISIRLERDLHKRFKFYCVEKGTTMQDVMVELLVKHLEKAEKEYSNNVRK